MKDVVVVDISAPQEEVASLFADPRNNAMWMHDLGRYEPVSGRQGMPGSKYRLIPKQGSMPYTATVIERKLPNALRLKLDSRTVVISVKGTLSPLPNGGTRLVSEEEFVFKGIWNKAFGILARPAIRKTHRQHMQAFKRFAEHQQ